MNVEPSTAPDVPGDSPGLMASIDWRACLTGAAFGLLVIVPVTFLRAILDHSIDNFADTGWDYPLFVLVLVGYATAGWVAARRGPRDVPLTHGAVAAALVLVVWLPIRVLIWVARDEDRGLFSGHKPALRPGQLFGHLVVACALGMACAWFASRRAAASATANSTGSGTRGHDDPDLR